MRATALLFFLSLGFNMNAQIDPVTWSTSVKKISGTEYELIATAEIEPGWHIYSQSVPEGGPIATKFTYKDNGKFSKKGNTIEEEGHVVNDPVFNLEIKYLRGKTTFRQRIKKKSQETFEIYASVRFMACDDTKCMPPKEVVLVFEIN